MNTNHTFSHDPGRLRMALDIGDDLYAESNLSANGIRDLIQQLLAESEIPTSEMKTFLSKGE